MTTLFDNLVSYWKLDETSGTRADSHGTNHLEDVNTVMSAAGKIGTAALFDAANHEYLYVPVSGDLQLGADTAFTVAFWVYATSAPGASGYSTLFTQVRAAPPVPVYLIYRYSDGHVWCDFAGNSTFVSVDGGSLSLNTWHLVIFWHNPVANTLNFQTDNGTVVSSAFSDGTFSSAGQIQLGSTTDLADAELDGLLDEVGFWTRVLTSAERSALYNSGAGLTYPFGLTGPTFMARPRSLLFTVGGRT